MLPVAELHLHIEGTLEPELLVTLERHCDAGPGRGRATGPVPV
jgi:hypothetical protein